MANRGGGRGGGSDNSQRIRGISFETFFEGWLTRQNQFLEELISVQLNLQQKTDDELKNLISRVLSHYQQYYEAKSIASRRDVFILFSPPWFSTYEKTFLWIAGFKPGLAFRIINNSVRDLSEEQKRGINKLMGETRAAEKELSDEMAMIQESVAGPSLVDLARRAGRLVDGESLEVDSAFQSFREAMECLVVVADFLRATTTRKVVEILNPVQAVRFLAAATQLQVRIRMLGSQRERERERERRRRIHDQTVVGGGGRGIPYY